MKEFNKTRELNKLRLKNNKSKYIKYTSIALSVIILVVGIIYFTFAKFESTKSYTLIEGRIGDYSSGDITLSYVVDGQTRNAPPESNVGFVINSVNCTNANAVWDSDKWSINISNISGKVKCDLDFKSITGVEYINSLSRYSLLTFDETSDNNLRYIGANPNNYVDIGEKFLSDIYFGYYSTSNHYSYRVYFSEQDCVNAKDYKSDCTKMHSAGDTSLWRIMGVMNNIKTASGQTQSLLKIVRNELLGIYPWDTSDTSINNGLGINQWGESTFEDGTSYEGSDLMRELNTDYLGNITVGTDGYWYNGQNNSKTAVMPTSRLSEKSQAMVENVEWNLGAPENDNGTIITSSNDKFRVPFIYTNERNKYTGKVCTSGNECNDTVTRTSTWTGKVGLIYLSDYYYATNGGTDGGGIDRNRSYCLGHSLNGWYFCNKTNWLYTSQHYWTITPSAKSTSVSNIWNSNQYYSEKGTSYYNGVLPAVYLKSTVKINGGTGTSDNPYTLE